MRFIGCFQASRDRRNAQKGIKKHRPRLMAGISLNRCSAGLSKKLMNIPGWNRVQYASSNYSRHTPGTRIHFPCIGVHLVVTIGCRWWKDEFEQALRPETKSAEMRRILVFRRTMKRRREYTDWTASNLYIHELAYEASNEKNVYIENDRCEGDESEWTPGTTNSPFMTSFIP